MLFLGGFVFFFFLVLLFSGLNPFHLGGSIVGGMTQKNPKNYQIAFPNISMIPETYDGM